jgi:hypothetical protein
MKKTRQLPGLRTSFLAALLAIVLITACNKNENPHGGQASQYSSEVLDKWMSMQLRLMKNATGVPNQAFSRHMAYAGITALESIAPGISQHAKKFRKWNGLNGLPSANQLFHYHYPANVNAAMASINRLLFPNAAAADKAAIDSLESAIRQEYVASKPASIINVSENFGKASRHHQLWRLLHYLITDLIVPW